MTDASSFGYIETTIPAGVTIAQYRAARPRRGTLSRVIGLIWPAR